MRDGRKKMMLEKDGGRQRKTDTRLKAAKLVGTEVEEIGTCEAGASRSGIQLPPCGHRLWGCPWLP
jgi:hypothetical protein